MIWLMKMNWQWKNLEKQKFICTTKKIFRKWIKKNWKTWKQISEKREKKNKSLLTLSNNLTPKLLFSTNNSLMNNLLMKLPNMNKWLLTLIKNLNSIEVINTNRFRMTPWKKLKIKKLKWKKNSKKDEESVKMESIKSLKEWIKNLMKLWNLLE